MLDGFQMMSRRVLKHAALQCGFNVTTLTPSSCVTELIAKLKPTDCGRDLIRIGGVGDGGYLIPDDLDGIKYCFSPGVSTTADFESELYHLRRIESFLADYSVARAPAHEPSFVFDKKFLGSIDNDKFFTLDTWKRQRLKDYEGDLILQMDIEGSEYQVILSTPIEVLKSFRIMVIEFHELQKLFDPFAFSMMSACFDKILTHFDVVHIHPNNFLPPVVKGSITIPPLMEFTFYCRQRVLTTGCRRSPRLPHPLDRENVPGNAALPLPACWR